MIYKILSILLILFNLSISVLHAQIVPKGSKRIEVKNNEIFYVNDIPYSGNHYDYYPNGNKKIEGNYKDGKKEGTWITYYENGQIKREENYENGLLNGVMTIWYKNGQVRYKTTYINGKNIKEKKNSERDLY